MENNRRIKLKKNYQLLIFVIMLFLSFVFINIGSGLLFSRHKADFTDSGKYTLSAASRTILKEIKNPVYIKIYLSQSLNKEYPSIAQYSQFVLRFLENYQNISPETIEIEIKNPEPFSKVEKEAKALGIEPFLSSNGQTNLYFGAVFTNDNGDSYTIPRFINQRRGYLENDISRILAKINEPVSRKVGIVSDNLPILKRNYADTSPVNWAFVEMLKSDYNLVPVSSQTVQIPIDMDALILVNPKNLSPLFIYALDQYIMSGGKILLLTDPFSEVAVDLNGSDYAGISNINKLLNNLGVSFDNNIVVGDISLSEKTIISNKDDSQLRDYPLWISADKSHINQNNIITKGLNRINFKSAGALSIADKHEAKITPLITTSDKGGSIDAELVRFSDKYTIAEQYKNDNRIYNLALLIEGRFDSIFTDNILGGTDFASQMLPFIAHSIEPAEIIVIADSDILDESSWTSDESAEDNGAYNVIPTTDNGDIIVRSIDYLVGNKQLLGINNRNVLENNKTVSEEIYQNSYNIHAEEYEQNSRELTEKEQTVEYMEEAVSDRALGVSMPLLQKIEQDKQEIKKLQDNIKYLDYIIRQESEKQINTIIIMNILVIPFSIIILIWLINIFYARRQKKKVMELVDEYKIS